MVNKESQYFSSVNCGYDRCMLPRTRAPASRTNSPPASRTAAAVSPADVVPIPVVITEREPSLVANFNN